MATTMRFSGRLAIVVIVLLVLAGCDALPQAPSTPEVEVVAPGVEVHTRSLGSGEPPAPDLRFISAVYELSPSGVLPAQATVTVRMPVPIAQIYVAVVVTRSSTADPWEYLPAVVAADRTSVSFTTTRFGYFGVLEYDLDQAVERFERDFVDGLAGGVPQIAGAPSCDNEQGARGEGYSAASGPGDALAWCLGEGNAGIRVLKVTNRRGYPLLASHRGMDVIENAVDWAQWPSLSRIAVGDKAVIAPGGTVAFNADLAAGASAAITTEADDIGHSLYALHATVTALVQALTRFAAGSGVRAAEITNKILAVQSCAGSLGKGSGDLVAGCLNAKMITDVFGPRGFLLAPILAAEPVVAYVAGQWKAIVDRFNGNSTYRVEIARAKPAVDLSVFAGDWLGHTRSLTITPDGHAKEHVGDGCCHPIVDLAFTVSAPQGTRAAATATITVTSVTLHDWVFPQSPPKIGQTATIKLANGVITEPLAGGTYCDRAASIAGICGA
ncbi:hypothetical protein [Lentzea sp. NPDC092896]|uniref:hypothetical protein n=1 Tax=Lentzea sp. NPDC092896 TaxID=3364127 RepID=UPI00380D7595